MCIDKKYAIRVDANTEIGLGHLMRCIEIAKEFKRRFIRVLFITYLNKQTEILKQLGFEIIDLNEYIFLNEKDLIKKILKEEQIVDMIIDKYNIEFDYFFELKKDIKNLIYIDDLNEYPYPVDMIINGNITALYMDYKKYFNNTKLLLGPQYYILRNEFIDININENTYRKTKNKILITTGGSDYKELSLKVINFVLSYNFFYDLELNIVVGPGFKEETIDRLNLISSNYENINLFIEPKNMAQIILDNDIVITAGGGTLYESLFLNKDIIGFIYAKNQEKIINIMANENYIDSIGWYNNEFKEILEKSIYDLCFFKKTFKKNMKFVISKNGAKNIVDKILEL